MVATGMSRTSRTPSGFQERETSPSDVVLDLPQAAEASTAIVATRRSVTRAVHESFMQSSRANCAPTHSPLGPLPALAIDTKEFGKNLQLIGRNDEWFECRKSGIEGVGR